MKKPSQPTKREPVTPGPKPELLKVDIDWKEAIKKSLEKKKPAGGWPK